MIVGAGHTQESDEPVIMRAISVSARVGFGHWQYVGEPGARASPILPAGGIGHLQTLVAESQIVSIWIVLLVIVATLGQEQ